MSSAEVLMFFMMMFLMILLVALLVYMWASLHILTGEDFAIWPTTNDKKRKREMEDITANIIAAMKNGGGTLPVRMPERRPPIEGYVAPVQQSFDEDISNITELNNPNWHTGVGPSEVAK